MFVEERHQEILHLLQENEKVKVKELSKQFDRFLLENQSRLW